MGNAFTGLIAALSAKVGVELKVQGEQRVHVNFDDFAMSLEYLPDAEQLLLSTAIAPTLGRNREALYRELLQGNFLFGGTQGATLALDKTESFVCLQIAPSLRALSVENFPVLVENFLNMAEHWRTRCLTPDQDDGGEADGNAGADEVGATFMRV